MARKAYTLDNSTTFTDMLPTPYTTARGEQVNIVAVVAQAPFGGVTSTLYTRLGDSPELFYNRKPVTYVSREQAMRELRPRMQRAVVSLVKKVGKNGGYYPA